MPAGQLLSSLQRLFAVSRAHPFNDRCCFRRKPSNIRMRSSYETQAGPSSSQTMSEKTRTPVRCDLAADRVWRDPNWASSVHVAKPLSRPCEVVAVYQNMRVVSVECPFGVREVSLIQCVREACPSAPPNVLEPTGLDRKRSRVHRELRVVAAGAAVVGPHHECGLRVARAE